MRYAQVRLQVLKLGPGSEGGGLNEPAVPLGLNGGSARQMVKPVEPRNSFLLDIPSSYPCGVYFFTLQGVPLEDLRDILVLRLPGFSRNGEADIHEVAGAASWNVTSRFVEVADVHGPQRAKETPGAGPFGPARGA